jgi:hypothetical protein
MTGLPTMEQAERLSAGAVSFARLALEKLSAAAESVNDPGATGDV